MPASKKNTGYVFIDLETSNADFNGEILQIAGLITDLNFKIKEEFNYKTKMTRPELADPESLKINGYSNASWAEAKELKEILQILQPKFKDKVVVGYNSHFDWARLEKAFFENDLADPFNYQRLDVLSMAFLKFNQLCHLTQACQKLGLRRENAHDAFSDANFAYQVFLKFNNRLDSASTALTEVEIYADGGAINNPGPAAIGVVIKFNGQIKKYGERIGERTNNQAEYEAVIFALKKIKHLLGKEKLERTKITIKVDSELIANQLNGSYKIEEAELQKLFCQFWNLKLDFPNLNIINIPREENLAHLEVERALKEKQGLF